MMCESERTAADCCVERFSVLMTTDCELIMDMLHS